MSESDRDVIVVGGSAGGLSAARMLERARRRAPVIESGETRNRYASHMHGVLGHDGVDPRELVAKGRAEASRYGVEFLDGSVERVDQHEHVLAVDATGRTSHRRIWAAGNATPPAQNVPMAMAAGAMARAVVNMALVDEDVDDAVAHLGQVEQVSA